MQKLTIKKSDGSTYWIERFETLPDLNKWLSEEKTRKYWQASFTTEIEDLTPPELSPAEKAQAIAQEQTRTAQLLALKARIVELDAQPDLTQAEIKESVRKLIKMLILNNTIR